MEVEAHRDGPAGCGCSPVSPYAGNLALAVAAAVLAAALYALLTTHWRPLPIWLSLCWATLVLLMNLTVFLNVMGQMCPPAELSVVPAYVLPLQLPISALQLHALLSILVAFLLAGGTMCQWAKRVFRRECPAGDDHCAPAERAQPPCLKEVLRRNRPKENPAQGSPSLTDEWLRSCRRRRRSWAAFPCSRQCCTPRRWSAGITIIFWLTLAGAKSRCLYICPSTASPR